MKYLGLILGIVSLLINKLFGAFPALADQLYYRGIFQVVRVVYDHTLGLLPIPMVYVVFAVLVWLISERLKVVARALLSSTPILTKIADVVLSVLNPVGYIIFAFYLLWGWNYQQTPFEDKMGFSPVAADTLALYQEALDVMEELSVLRSAVVADTSHIVKSHVPEDLERHLRQVQEELIATWGEPTVGRVRIRELRPSGILLRISTSGVYIPFVSEGHIDAGLHALQYPFTMAHEMAHGYGYTDEGVCNFISYLTCLQSSYPMVQYSGLLGYWRYVLSNLRTYAPASFQAVKQQMPQPLRTDLQDISLQMDKYPDLLPQVRNAVYDSYLRSHGVKAGIANYNDIVRLVAQYRQQQEGQQ